MYLCQVMDQLFLVFSPHLPAHNFKEIKLKIDMITSSVDRKFL